MTGAQYVAEAYLKGTGKISTLTSADDAWKKLIQLGTYYQTAWVNEPGVFWKTRYAPATSCGTVTNTDTFTIASTIYAISNQDGDFVRIIYTDTTKWSDWNIVDPERLKYYTSGNYVARVGNTLKFNKTFISTDSEYGGTIYVPGYTIPADLNNDGSDTIIVDDPHWLTTRAAAEYIRTDLVQQNQYPNLIIEANQLMIKMKQKNNPQVETLTLERADYGPTW